MAQRYIGDWCLEIGEDGTVYRYKLIQQHASSDKLGPCEICGEFVSDVFHQMKERQFFSSIDEEVHWAHERGTFGHQECLIKIRRND
jgi:hypothetical protein